MIHIAMMGKELQRAQQELCLMTGKHLSHTPQQINTRLHDFVYMHSNTHLWL